MTGRPGDTAMSRPPLEVADVVRQHGAAFLARYGPTLSGEQHRALRAIAVCRTAPLGGHITQCDHCGHEVQAYNSCRHRSCPKCHGAAQATWLATREREVLETPYAHVIFPLPHALGPLALQHPRQLYGLLFRTVAQALQDIAQTPKHLGAEIGGLAVLHTWGQQLHHHPQLQCVLPAGGLAPGGTQWLPCRPHFFLPVRVLSRRFRRLYLAELEHLSSQGQLTLTGRCRERAEPQPWQQFLADVRAKEWVVYAKEPRREPQHVLKYLARYTPRVAISNHRLVALEDGQVTFRYKDYQRGHRLRTRTLDAVEFLRRLMLPVPPRGFHRMRHFGFLANRGRQEKLAQCRTLLRQAAQPQAQEEAMDLKPPEGSAGGPGAVCPVCQHGRMQLVQTLMRHWAAWDLSVPTPVCDTS
jgi:Putative transposase/Transposase zinc-binding domain